MVKKWAKRVFGVNPIYFAKPHKYEGTYGPTF